MTELLAAARSSYDVVVLDTSALLAVTDGAVAASNADGVILLVRHGVTARDDVLRSVETLRAVNAPMLGAVLSMVPADRSERRAARPGKASPPAVLADKSRPSAAAATPSSNGAMATPTVTAQPSPTAGPATPTATADPSSAKPTAAEVAVEDLPTVVSPRVELADGEPVPGDRGVTASATTSGPSVESVPPKAPAEP
jgi:hypothetical protein